MNDEVIRYIIEAKGYGLSEEEIQKNLKLTGWNDAVIAESFAEYKKPKNAPAVEKPVMQIPTDSKPIAVTQEPAAVVILPTQETPPITSRRRRILPILAIVVLLILGGGGYAAAEYFGFVPTTIVFDTPEKIWGEFLITPQEKIYSTKFEFSYSDPNSKAVDQGEASDQPLNSAPSSIEASITGSAYINESNPDDIEADGELLYSFGTTNTKLSAKTPFKIKNKTFYINLDNNAIFGEALGTSPSGWYGFGAGELDDTELKSKIGDEITKPLQEFFTQGKWVKSKKFIGYEELDNIRTAQYSLTLDSDAISSEIVNRLAGIEVPAEEKAQAEQIIKKY